jgi:hypothetical protein
MELKTIELNVDKSKEIYASTDCQQLINSMNEYYPIGFNKHNQNCWDWRFHWTTQRRKS